MTDLPAYLRPFVLGVLEGSDVRVDRLGEIDLYRPPGTARGGAILFVHGGPGPDGLEVMPRDWPVYKGYATAAARRGLVAAVVDHSLIHGLDRLVVAADEVEAAVAVLRSDPRVDPDRVGLWFFSGAGLLAGEWLDSRPDWLRFVSLSYPLLATPPGVDDLVTAAEVIGKHKDLPVLLTRAGLEREELAGPVAEFVSAGGAALDIIDVPKGHHGFDMLDHTEESRAAVTKALDWAIAHLGEQPGDDGKLLVPPPPARKKATTPRRRTPAAPKAGVAVQDPPVAAEPAVQQAPRAVPAPVTQSPLVDLGAATVAAVTTETAAARAIDREHAAYAAHDLEAFLAMYSPTARIQLADGSELKGRRFLREYYRPRFDAGRCKTEVVQKITLGEWVVEHVNSYEHDTSTAQLALYRVVDGLITDVEFRA
ncbi:nuclear transport factor 2 family protein [Kribbella sp.]|uniref:nuclear transport factor 2 family protein n=1 Tax=Kribbella sp. TaxID=1871183 RepID=UPI002D35925F|nr:nuclear transport factor 2 family protein [Kribbella sp.]HZX02703.1 nuclear transport factor 2 family protein [Kribbella sp.]